ncbi:MAG TPA: TPM domain-containing protein [Sphingomicrobium sp.]
MVRFLAGLWLAVLLAATPAHAQNFPKLTGRVVDEANLLSPAQEAELSAKSEALEKTTGRQFVVATVNSLNDQEIADYSYQLGRHWKIGDEQRDDGIVMVVAPNERKVWVATGYGAEGFLPDILIGRIVRDTILPRFKAGDMAGGIIAGADAVIAQSQLPADQAQQRVEQARADQSRREVSINPIPIIFMVIVFFFIVGSIARAGGGRRYRGKGRRRGGLDSGDVAVILWGLDALSRGSRGGGGWGGGGWGGGGGGFGGFSGGGGSFGGGGAGGSW